MNKRKLGGKNEQIAAEYLKNNGFEVLETNYFCKAGEIDIIAREGEYLCFIEVKYRKSTENGFPEEAVDLRKAGRISRSALFYMNSKGLTENYPCRFDVVSILKDEIILIRNAFEALL